MATELETARPEPKAVNAARRIHTPGSNIIVRVERFTEPTGEAVRVPLFGQEGCGLHMVLDASVWDAGLAAGWPAAWVARAPDYTGRKYVATTCRPTSPKGQPVWLSRVIMDAQPGDIICFKDGDSLNLRLSNLTKASPSKLTGGRYCEEVIDVRISPPL